MSILQQMRTAKHGFHVVLLVLLSLLNAGHLQSTTGLSHACQPSAERLADSGHAGHGLQPAGDCGSADACKSTCDWFCQLAHALEPLSSLPAAYAWAVGPLPAYSPHSQPSSASEQDLRPPISV